MSKSSDQQNHDTPQDGRSDHEKHNNQHSNNHKDHGNYKNHKSHENNGDHSEHEDHQNHHAHMVVDFRLRFWVSLAFSIPVVLLAPLIQEFMDVKSKWDFAGDSYIQFGFATIVFFTGAGLF